MAYDLKPLNLIEITRQKEMTKVVMPHEWDKDGYLWLIIKVGLSSTKDMSNPEEARQELEEARK